MKQFIILLLIGFNINVSYGQLASIKELMLVMDANDNTAEKLLNAKGFAIYKFKDTSGYTQTSFALNKNVHDDNADGFIAIAKFSSGKKIVSMDFGNLFHFSKSKTEAETLGFIFVRTEMSSTKSRYQEYKKGNLVLTFWTNTYTPTTQYEIALERE